MQPEFVKSLRRIAVELDTTLQEIGVEAFEAWVATNHLRIKAVGLGKEIIKMSSKDFQKVTK